MERLLLVQPAGGGLSLKATETLCQEEEMRFLLSFKGRFLWQCREPCAQQICWEWRGLSESRISKNSSSISSPTTAAPPHRHSCLLSLII